MERKLKYIVTRDEHLVSENEHDTIELAKIEYEYWNKIISKWPDGTKIEIKTLTD
jgi:hypothetical protein